MLIACFELCGSEMGRGLKELRAFVLAGIGIFGFQLSM